MSAVIPTDEPKISTTTTSKSSGDGVLPEIQKSADDSNGFRWSEAWHQWVPVDQPRHQPLPELQPLPTGPLEPEKHRCNDPRCIDCWNAGQRYGEYLKAKRLDSL